MEHTISYSLIDKIREIASYRKEIDSLLNDPDDLNDIPIESCSLEVPSIDTKCNSLKFVVDDLPKMLKIQKKIDKLESKIVKSLKTKISFYMATSDCAFFKENEIVFKKRLWYGSDKIILYSDINYKKLKKLLDKTTWPKDNLFVESDDSYNNIRIVKTGEIPKIIEQIDPAAEFFI